MIERRTNLVAINNVTFGKTPETFHISYAYVVSVRNHQLQEILFSGTMDECFAYVEKNGLEHTATPTCQFMPISRVLPGARGSKAKFAKPRSKQPRKVT